MQVPMEGPDPSWEEKIILGGIVIYLVVWIMHVVYRWFKEDPDLREHNDREGW